MWNDNRLNVLALATMLIVVPVASRAQDGNGKRKTETKQTGAASVPNYRIGPGDVLQIVVYKEPDASVPEVTVRTDGKISLPFVGEVPAAGQTPSELETSLTKDLTRFIKEPDVSVLVKSVQSEKVFVIGSVKKGGPIRLTGSMTVLEALSEAGLDDFANRNKIYVLRTEGGKKVKLPFRYKDVIQGKHSEQNVLLRAGDTIVVP
jgi:polysaccharide biosynthesis/export protein